MTCRPGRGLGASGVGRASSVRRSVAGKNGPPRTRLHWRHALQTLGACCPAGIDGEKEMIRNYRKAVLTLALVTLGACGGSDGGSSIAGFLTNPSGGNGSGGSGIYGTGGSTSSGGSGNSGGSYTCNIQGESILLSDSCSTDTCAIPIDPQSGREYCPAAPAEICCCNGSWCWGCDATSGQTCGTQNGTCCQHLQ